MRRIETVSTYHQAREMITCGRTDVAIMDMEPLPVPSQDGAGREEYEPAWCHVYTSIQTAATLADRPGFTSVHDDSEVRLFLFDGTEQEARTILGAEAPTSGGDAVP